ncbi:GNAT family N-acetyltransferase [Bacillus marasmi]|uniref:GNAT family N-acetyltransferase n=1 Tax=Bacillus marasmi TaxID=1926279 RepID=UPI0011C9E6CB|nr:GNAT family N-acetyltransferase [Bacillus marasmi]
MTITIEYMEPSDWKQVSSIYLEGISTGNATFQTSAPSYEDWDNGHVKSCRLVAKTGDKIVGWAVLSPTSSRCVYAGVAEVSIYVGLEYSGKGIGSLLLKRLIEESEQHGFWTLQSGIFPENISSLKIHKKNGFREIGRREKLGKMNGVWRDVVLLERRSTKIGID